MKQLCIEILTILFSAQNECHFDNPGCTSMNPDSTVSFQDCCVSDDGLLRQSSYMMGTGPGSCIRCATLGTVELFYGIASTLCMHIFMCTLSHQQ